MIAKKSWGVDAMLKFAKNEPKKINLNPHNTVLQFKKKLIGKSNLTPNDLLMTLNGQMLKEDNKKINQYGFKPNSLITVEVMESKGPKFSFNSLMESIAQQFSDDAPAYRTVFPGLVLEAKCTNKKCIACNDFTLVNKGFGNFELAKQISQCVCPACHEATEQAVNMGYYFTKIKIEGKKPKQKSEVILDEVSADDRYHTFMTEDELEEWNFITVTTEQIK